MKKSPSRTPESPVDGVTVRVAARQTGVPRREIRQMLRQGRLPFVQVRGQIRVTNASVKRLATRR